MALDSRLLGARSRLSALDFSALGPALDLGWANFETGGLVDTDVFGERRRRTTSRDPLEWTEYRWESHPWQGGSAWRPARVGRASWAGIALAGLGIYFAARLFAGLHARNGSWIRKGLYALLLLMIASAFTRTRRGRWHR